MQSFIVFCIWEQLPIETRLGLISTSKLALQTERDKDQHADCERQEAQLREDLHEAKACLEMVNLGGPLANQKPYGPRGAQI